MSQQPTVGPAHGMGTMTAADIWRIVRKRFLLIVVCVVLVGGGATGGLVAWWYKAPFYAATGVLEFEPGQGQANPLTPGWDPGIPIQMFVQYMKSQVMAIKNDRVLKNALTALADKPEVSYGPGASYDLSQDLDVTYLDNTQNILVRLKGRNREGVVLVVREVVTQYVKQLRDERLQADADRQKELVAERDDLRRQLEDLGRRLATLRTETNVLDDRGGEQMVRLTALARQLTDAQVLLAEANAAWTQFQELKKQADEAKDISGILMAFPEIMEAMRADRSLASITDQYSRASQELGSLKQRFGPMNESVKRVEAVVQSTKNDLEAKQSEVLGQLFQQQAASLKSRYDRGRSLEAELQARVAEARSAAVDAARVSAEYRSREEEFRRVQALLNTIQDGLEKMRISAAMARPNVRVAQWPTLPEYPTEPRLLLYIPAAFFFSVLVGLGLSLLIELMETRLRSPAEVVRQVGVPLLASVPDISEDERLSLDTNVATVSQTVPQSLMAESFRQFRTGLQFATDHPPKCLLITSPTPGDGKSSVAANLAITMARSGTRVLLVEANFRRPSVARLFDVPATIGLSNVLVGLNSAAEAIQATAIENLDVLPGGAVPPSPAELLGSATMRQFLADQAHAYDQVIIDGAPLLVVADIHLLVAAVDGVVLVYRAGENTRGLAVRAARQVHALRGRLMGAVLNRVRATKGGYFRESFQAYYDYSGAACPVDLAPAKRDA